MQPSRDKGVKEFCVGVALFICVSLLSNFLLAGCLLPGFGGQSFASIAIFSACGVFAMLFLQAAFYQYILGGKGTYLVYALWLLVFFCALSNTFLNHIEFIRYGDAGFLPWAVETNIPFTRWLAGSAVLGWLYAIIQLLQIDISASELVKVAGSLVMAASSCLLVFRYPGRLAILISLLTPVWWIFISGYDEYYPFIAGAFVYSLAIFHYESLEGRPVFTAANAALLALLYIGFLPMSMLLVAKYFYQNRSARILSLILLVAFYLLGVAVFWPESIIDYFQSLPSDMNLGEKNTVYTPYIGQSISGNSPWFKPGYALSATHLLHLLHMQLWGGGWLIPCVFLLAFGSAIASGHFPSAWRRPPPLRVIPFLEEV